jgi:hypothetical protein
LYGHYLKEDCTEVATKNNYFNFESLNGEYVVNIKPEYRNIIEGKITLPSKNGDIFVT